MVSSISRRRFLQQSALTSLALAAAPTLARAVPDQPVAKCRFGLVTYLWGKDLTLPKLLDVCEASQVLGVELRTTHAHGVEPELSEAARREVRQRFADRPVELVGIGSNERYDSPNPTELKTALERTKQFLQLSQDVGSSGVKVKGDQFYDEVPREKTLDQVVGALRELGDFAANLGQQVRLEVHGGFRDLPTHHEIIHRTDHPHVRTCWNSNNSDLDGDGLDQNFQLVRPYFGATAHVSQLDTPGYPWERLIKLFVASNYDGWLLLEASGSIAVDEVSEKLVHQRKLFEQYLAAAQA
jgi:sugar phosphate isomerase/epimerase